MMNGKAAKQQAATPPPGRSEAFSVARRGVRDMLMKCPAFQSLSPDQQRDIAKHTVEVVDYLAAPEGVPGHKLPAGKALGRAADPYALPLAGDKFEAEAAREGAKVAGLLLEEVNFESFVTGLIEGVFGSVVTASIEQMEAYGKLVADVAKTLNQFRDENVSDNQGRDHLVDTFPDVFELDIDTGESGEAQPRVRLKESVDESVALDKVNSLPLEGGPLNSLDMDDDEVENQVVQASRTQLATSRQQLLATMVLMGINRIVVTDGRIHAKVMYDFKAKEKFKRSATDFDYEDFGMRYVSEGTYETDQQGGSSTYEKGSGGEVTRERQGSSYWTQGQYKNTAEPTIKITSISASSTDAMLETKAKLAGEVDLNFKSETLPLEKMADSFQISQIQEASQRGKPSAKPATE